MCAIVYTTKVWTVAYTQQIKVVTMNYGINVYTIVYKTKVCTVAYTTNIGMRMASERGGGSSIVCNADSKTVNQSSWSVVSSYCSVYILLYVYDFHAVACNVDYTVP